MSLCLGDSRLADIHHGEQEAQQLAKRGGVKD
jgi:hypothetical protein